MLTDVFSGDAFTVLSLTKGIIKAPYKPSRIAQLGLFGEEGVATTSIMIEAKNGQLSLVQTSPRGGTGTAPLVDNKRTARSFPARHLERESKIMADSVQGVRAFGSDNSTDAVQAVVDRRLATLRQMLEVTLEWHRVGAIKGEILDADGTTVLSNLYTEFGVAQQTHEIGANPRSDCTAIMRMVEDELGAQPVSAYRAFCGDDFFDTFIELDAIKDTLKYQEGSVLRQDLRQGFTFGGITWENYRGRVSGQDFFPADEAYVVPVGTDIFQTWFAPADFMETVNTIGLPMYAKMFIDRDLQRWAQLHAQSNPLAINTRPRAVVKVTIGT